VVVRPPDKVIAKSSSGRPVLVVPEAVAPLTDAATEALVVLLVRRTFETESIVTVDRGRVAARHTGRVTTEDLVALAGTPSPSVDARVLPVSTSRRGARSEVASGAPVQTQIVRTAETERVPQDRASATAEPLDPRAIVVLPPEVALRTVVETAVVAKTGTIDAIVPRDLAMA
jgi:hypothetical protein